MKINVIWRKGENMKKIILKVNGMVCNGCENRVENTLKNIEQVAKVKANHKKNLVTITLKEEIDTDILEKAIENLGYEIIKED